MKISEVSIPDSAKVKSYFDNQDMDNCVFSTIEIKKGLNLKCSTRSIIDTFISFGLQRFKINHISVYWGTKGALKKFAKRIGG